jgi:hypothetical protein
VLGGGQGALTRCQEAPFVGKVLGGGHGALTRCQEASFVGKVLGGGQGALRRCQEADTVCWESVGRRTKCTEKESGGRHVSKLFY